MKLILFIIILTFQLFGGKLNNDEQLYSVGLSPGIMMPGQEYVNSFSLGGQLVYGISEKYNIKSLYRFSTPEAELNPNNHTPTQFLFFTLQNTKSVKDEIKISTGFGIGIMKIENNINPGFLFDVTFTKPINNNFDFGGSIENYMGKLQLPFITFPNFSIYAHGSGDQYLLFNLFLNYRFK